MERPRLDVAAEERVQLVVERPDAVRERDVLGDPRQVARLLGRAVEERARCAASSRGRPESGFAPGAPATVLPSDEHEPSAQERRADVGEVVVAPDRGVTGSSSASCRRIDR